MSAELSKAVSERGTVLPSPAVSPVSYIPCTPGSATHLYEDWRAVDSTALRDCETERDMACPCIGAGR